MTRRTIYWAAPFVGLLLLVLFLPVLWVYGHMEIYCVFYPGIDTKYAPGFTEQGFDMIKVGQTASQVEQTLGRPLSVRTNKLGVVKWWYTGDGKCWWGDFAWLGRWVSFQDGRVIKAERHLFRD